MTILGRALRWLRAPMPGRFRARGTPARYHRQVSMTHLDTRVYEGSVISGDQLFSGTKRAWTPYLVYHDWRVTWAGAEYLVQQKDWPQRYRFRNGQSFPGWVDPEDLSTVWIMDAAHQCQPWPDGYDEKDEDAWD